MRKNFYINCAHDHHVTFYAQNLNVLKYHENEELRNSLLHIGAPVKAAPNLIKFKSLNPRVAYNSHLGPLRKKAVEFAKKHECQYYNLIVSKGFHMKSDKYLVEFGDVNKGALACWENRS